MFAGVSSIRKWPSAKLTADVNAAPLYAQVVIGSAQLARHIRQRLGISAPHRP